jgi:acetyl-CoA acetyltransferase
MAIAFEKQSDGDMTIGLATVALADMVGLMGLGMPLKAAMGRAGGAAGVTVFQATSYMHRSGCKLEHLDKISTLCRNNAAKKAYKLAGIGNPEKEIDGDLPTDPSGGVLCTNAIGASAMERVAECALQIMGKARNIRCRMTYIML